MIRYENARVFPILKENESAGDLITKPKDTKSILDGVVDEIERADTFEAVSILNQVQTQLEASYATAVRVSSLSLTKFLT